MDQRWVDLAHTLRELGMWHGFSPEEAAEGEQAVANGSYPFGGEATVDEEPGTRYFFVDGETMAEAGVRRVLEELEPALRDQGVDLRMDDINRPRVTEDGDYVISINNRRCTVWTPADWESKQAWKVSTTRPLAVINDLLAEAGATPRLYTLGAGQNDGIAWLLDPRIVNAVAESGLVNDLPQLATHDQDPHG